MSIKVTEKQRRVLASAIMRKQYFMKKEFEHIAVQIADPMTVPEITMWSREEYLKSILASLNDSEVILFTGEIIKRIEWKSLYYEDKREDTDFMSFLDSINMITRHSGITFDVDGTPKTITEYTILPSLKSNVLDLIDKYDLKDVHKLFEKGHDNYLNGDYSECIRSCGIGFEGVLKKAVITLRKTDDEESLKRDINKAIGGLLQDLVNLNFWKNSDPAFKVADVFRSTFRNISSHYSSSDQDLRIREFSSSEALFAYYLSLTLTAYILERLQDF